jgi:hypothetical protein
MQQRTEYLLLLAVVFFFAVLVVLSQREELDVTVQSQAGARVYTSYSTLPPGYQALYDTLKACDLPVQRFNHSFDQLPPAGTLIVADAYRTPMSRLEGQRLLKWVGKGNHALVLVEHHAGILFSLLASDAFMDPEQQAKAEHDYGDAWFSQDDAFAGAGGNTSVVVPSFLSQAAPALQVNSVTRLRDAIALTPDAIARVGGVVPLYRDKYGVVAAYSAVGQGGIVWCTSPWSFSTAGIAKGDNLAFVVALAQRQPGAPVLFDEYHHGFGNGTTVWTLLPRIAKLGVLQISVALLLLLIVLAWRFGPAQQPAEERFSRSRAEYLTAMASLLERARATHVVRERMLNLLRRELGRRLGLPPTATPQQYLEANSRHAVVEQATLERIMRVCEAVSRQQRPDPGVLLRLAGDVQRMLQRKPGLGE